MEDSKLIDDSKYTDKPSPVDCAVVSGDEQPEEDASTHRHPFSSHYRGCHNRVRRRQHSWLLLVCVILGCCVATTIVLIHTTEPIDVNSSGALAFSILNHASSRPAVVPKCNDCGINSGKDRMVYLQRPENLTIAVAEIFPLVVVGTVKNVPQELVANVINMISSGVPRKWRSQVHFAFFGENDWDEDFCEPPACTVIRGQESTSKVRTERIAKGRNVLLAKSASLGANTTVVIDPDLAWGTQFQPVDLLASLRLAHKWFKRGHQAVSWAGQKVSATQKTFEYYDFWALRYPRQNCDVYTCEWNLETSNRHQLLQLDARRGLMEELSHDMPLAAQSAFNGVAVYKGAPVKCKYTGWNNSAGVQICEHVPFHKCLGGVVIEVEQPLMLAQPPKQKDKL
mgnify:CR=1 FL=1